MTIEFKMLCPSIFFIFVLSSDRNISNDELSVREKLKGKRYKNIDMVSVKICLKWPLLKNLCFLEWQKDQERTRKYNFFVRT